MTTLATYITDYDDQPAARVTPERRIPTVTRSDLPFATGVSQRVDPPSVSRAAIDSFAIGLGHKLPMERFAAAVRHDLARDEARSLGRRHSGRIGTLVAAGRRPGVFAGLTADGRPLYLLRGRAFVSGHGKTGVLTADGQVTLDYDRAAGRWRPRR